MQVPQDAVIYCRLYLVGGLILGALLYALISYGIREYLEYRRLKKKLKRPIVFGLQGRSVSIHVPVFKAVNLEEMFATVMEDWRENPRKAPELIDKIEITYSEGMEENVDYSVRIEGVNFEKN